MPAPKRAHLDDLTGAVQAGGCQRGLRQRGTLDNRPGDCVQKAYCVPGRDSQDLKPARQERNKAHEAGYAQLGRLLVAAHRPAPVVQEVVQAYATQRKRQGPRANHNLSIILGHRSAYESILLDIDDQRT